MSLESNKAFENFIDNYFENLEQKAKKLQTDDYSTGIVKGITTAKVVCKNLITDANDDFTKTIFYTKNRLQKILLDAPPVHDRFSKGFRESITLVAKTFANLSQFVSFETDKDLVDKKIKK